MGPWFRPIRFRWAYDPQIQDPQIFKPMGSEPVGEEPTWPLQRQLEGFFDARDGHLWRPVSDVGLRMPVLVKNPMISDFPAGASPDLRMSYKAKTKQNMTSSYSLETVTGVFFFSPNQTSCGLLWAVALGTLEKPNFSILNPAPVNSQGVALNPWVWIPADSPQIMWAICISFSRAIC